MTLPPTVPTATPWPLPWRSAWLGAAVAVVALVAGVPLFLRMPPWCDLTLYDVAARNLLDGGVHYRDVFDTNMPGFVWLLAMVRWLFGWSVEAVRIVDLLIVGGIVFVLERLAAAGGASRAVRAWAIAAVVLFYLFQSEFNHVQRDIWMMLPALIAVGLRFRRLADTSQSRGEAFRDAVLEGILWGVAVWIKPHVVIPAVTVWLLTAARGRPFVDLLGQVLGGGAIGLIGIAYLVHSGTWPHFIDVFTTWNTGYAATMFAELPMRYYRQLHYFPPFSFLQYLSLPVAGLSILEGRPWCRRPVGPGFLGRHFPAWLWDAGASDRVRFARLVLAGLYLGWTAQALYFQRDFHYVHVPETLMLLFVLATQRWAAGAFVTAWLAISSAIVLAGSMPAANVTGVGPEGGPEWAVLHPALDPQRMKHWPDCWRLEIPTTEYRRRMNAVGLVHEFHAANDWEQLGEVTDWLAAHDVKDGEVVGWHDSTHAAYLDLHIKPGIRFQHVSHISGLGGEERERVDAELERVAPQVRYVISDLLRVSADGPKQLDDPNAPGVAPGLLPPGLAEHVRQDFPFNQPAVFRSNGGHGRYIIHELRHPFTQPHKGS